MSLECLDFTTGWVGTFSGKQIDLINIQASDIELMDIAVGLANQCRYAGQVWPFYSVAEHSVLVSHMVMFPSYFKSDPGINRNKQAQLALKALLHDAPEFILHDVIRPVKRRLGGYAELERRVMGAVSVRFGLNYSDQDWETIKLYDDLITIAERDRFQQRIPADSYGRGVDRDQIPYVAFHAWSPRDAALHFLRTYCWLTGRPLAPNQKALLASIMRPV